VKLNLLALLPLVAALAIGQNLLVNGDFEQDLTVGWTTTTGGSGYGLSTRSTGYDPDPDYEAMDSLYAGAGWRLCSQTVDAPGVMLNLEFWAKFAIGGGSSTCWPVACITVGYLDAADNQLGETRFYYHNSYCTWVPSATLSLHEVTNPDWSQYDMNVADELSANLPGVNPGDVAKIRVGLYNYTAGG
jgi:hypothetical protein